MHVQHLKNLRKWISLEPGHMGKLQMFSAIRISMDMTLTVRQVWKAMDKRTKDVVALKRIRMETEKEGV
jgi:hypothetical protein